MYCSSVRGMDIVLESLVHEVYVKPRALCIRDINFWLKDARGPIFISTV